MLNRLFQNSLKARHRYALVGLAFLIGMVLSFGAAGIGPKRFNDALLRLDRRLYETWATRWIEEQPVPAKVAEQIVLVLIDDQSLEDLSLPYPLPRSLYLEIVKRLEAAGAKVIALDLLFLEPSGSLEEDAALAEALNNPLVVSGMLLEFDGPTLVTKQPPESLMDPEGAQGRLGFVNAWAPSGSADVAIKVSDGENHHYSLVTTAFARHQEIDPEEAVEAMGITPTFMGFSNSREVETYALNINYAAKGMLQDIDPGGEDPVEATDELIYEGGIEIRSRPTLQRILPVVPLHDLLQVPVEGMENAFPPNFIAVVGVSATAGSDKAHTVLGMMSGPEVQANLLLNLFLKNPIRQARPTTIFLVTLGVPILIGLVGALVAHPVGIGASVLACLGLGYANYASYVGVGYASGGMMLPFFFPALGVLLVQVAATTLHFQTERSDFLDVIRQVCPVVDPDTLLSQGIRLGGEARELTILFSDLRSYTSFAEKLDAVSVLDALNDYFGAVGHIFEKHGGLVFDYQGDAQMVVFGLVEASQPNHGAAACRAAAEMILTLEEMRAIWSESGKDIPETGIGVCTGPISFGFMGTAQRKQLVAIGDPTNSAARVQGKSKEFNSPVLTTESTVLLAQDEILFEEIDEIYVKGKKEPLKVFGVQFEEMRRKGMIEVDQQVIRTAKGNTQ